MKGKFISGKVLMRRWKIEAHELMYLVHNGLQPWHPGNLEKYSVICEEDRQECESYEGYAGPQAHWFYHSIGEIFPHLDAAVFLLSDVEATEVKKSPGSRKPTDRQKDIKKATVIAKKYIADYEAVKLIEKEGKLSREYTGKHTIHDWIKGGFPEASREQGQGRPKKE
jgi:hypothetical protein